jgi:hypothetical protein
MPQDQAPVVDAPVDEKTDYAVRRMADLHACLGLSDEPLTREQARAAVSNAAYLLLVGAGMTHADAATALRGLYAF